MVDQDGGRWDVGRKNNAVYLERRSEDNELLFEAQLAPEEARDLAEQMANPEAKRIMLGIAVSYVALAQMAEERDAIKRGP